MRLGSAVFLRLMLVSSWYKELHVAVAAAHSAATSRPVRKQTEHGDAALPVPGSGLSGGRDLLPEFIRDWRKWPGNGLPKASLDVLQLACSMTLETS
jgi:hypothetical protein